MRKRLALALGARAGSVTTPCLPNCHGTYWPLSSRSNVGVNDPARRQATVTIRCFARSLRTGRAPYAAQEHGKILLRSAFNGPVTTQESAVRFGVH
jgi:hypothetical protein